MKTHIRALLREGIDGMTNEALIGKFVDFVVDYLGIKTKLSLVLTTDKSDIETTAFYDIANKIICVYTKERAIGDIMRSIAHEMVHHMQNIEGRLGNIGTTNTNEDDHLLEIEQEAYLKGNITFRNWEDSIKNS